MSDKPKTFEEWWKNWITRRWREQGLVLYEEANDRAEENGMDSSAEAAWNAAIESMQEEIDKRDEIILELLKSIDETCDHVTFDMYYAIGKIEKFYGIDFCKMQEIEKLNGVKDEN